MVAFEQNLVAAANAHHLMTQPVYARGVVTRAEQQEYSREQREEVEGVDRKTPLLAQNARNGALGPG
jgi:hypothetical protein